MNISIIGTGYVGLSTGVGFSSKGNNVICVDIIKEKVEKINEGISPIYEPGMEESLKDAIMNGRLKATLNYSEAILNSEVTLISVPTPMNNDGSADLGYIESAATKIGEVLAKKDEYHVVAVKSTVVPGTVEDVVIPAIEKSSGKKLGSDFGAGMIPEFLREGYALKDFLNPDRIVIGSNDEKSMNVLKKMHTGFDAPIIEAGIKTAEMIKYASNAFLATKISFANEIGNICKRMGIDVYDVMRGVGLDNRINEKFLRAGSGFGGSCFPKDVSAIAFKGKNMGLETLLLDSVIEVNKRQRQIIVDMLVKKLGNISGQRIAILGLTFNPGSDDVRESPSIYIISSLKEMGAKVCAYDTHAMKNAKKEHPDIEYAKNAKDCIEGADACLVLAELEEFSDLTDNDFDTMKNRIILEGKRILDPNKVHGYEGICWPYPGEVKNAKTAHDGNLNQDI